jgi:uncharacterized membrane protein (UPF0127 family)
MQRIAVGTLVLAVLAGAPALAQSRGWCHALPLERSFCRALAIETPKTTLRLAVADTESGRERGLMGLRVVPAGEGMIFVFPEQADVRRDFWMKDTIAPLDMIWVRTDGTVTSIAAKVPATKPHASDAQIARRYGFGRYVIELGSGDAQRAGLHPGLRLTVPDLDAT